MSDNGDDSKVTPLPLSKDDAGGKRSSSRRIVKRCPTCRRVLPIKTFAKTGKNKRRYECNRCNSRRKRGVDPVAAADLDRLVLSCQGCGRTDRLGVDHNHDTGLVRGILCLNCNRLLGLAHDSAETLRSLADYVER